MEKIKHFIIIFFFITISQTAWAVEFVVDGFRFFGTDTEPYTATVYNDENTSYVGEIVIPDMVSYEGITYTVTGIGGFRFCYDMTSVVIPNTVTEICYDHSYYGTFAGDTNLISVNIPNSVTKIGERAFSGCKSLTSITIPNSVTYIGTEAFSYCDGLTSVTIGNSITSNIGIFSGIMNHNITSIDIAPDNPRYKSIDGVVFSHAADTLILYPGGRQGSYSIPNSVTSIGRGAFYYCTGLISVNIPNSITAIEDRTFSYCSGLTNVHIPNSVTRIGSSFTSTTWSLSNGAFSHCSSLTAITIPNSVDSLGVGTFAYSGLTSITIPNSLTVINDAAFYGCSNLKSINLPNTVTSIGKSAFAGCSGLESITIPNSVDEICERAFENCTSLKYVTSLRITPPTLVYDIHGNSNCFSSIDENSRLTVKCYCQGLYMNSDWNQWFSTIEQSCDSHSITVIEATQPGGTVSTSLNEAYLGSEVEINITTTPGYAIRSILVFNVIDNTQTVPTYKKSETSTSQTFAFSMPAYNVKVYADIRPSGLAIEEQNSVAVNIFPNPTKSSVTIEAENMQRICVYNIMGQKVLDNATTGNKFECDMRSYNKGVYLILIETGKGIKTKQLIVE